ncbi:hypothetical protein GCM10029964_054590 [Kibdelosporangium lantanae]
MAGDVDISTSAGFLETIHRAVRPGPPVLVIDMTDVSFLSAAGLSMLVATRERTRAAGVDLRLVACRREVLRPLRLTGLSTVFDIYPTVADACDMSTTDG